MSRIVHPFSEDQNQPQGIEQSTGDSRTDGTSGLENQVQKLEISHSHVLVEVPIPVPDHASQFLYAASQKQSGTVPNRGCGSAKLEPTIANMEFPLIGNLTLVVSPEKGNEDFIRRRVNEVLNKLRWRIIIVRGKTVKATKVQTVRQVRS